MKTTKNKNDIESLLFNFSTQEEKDTIFNSKIEKILVKFDKLYESLETTFSKKDEEYGEAFKILVEETGKQIKQIITDFSKKNTEIDRIIKNLESNSSYSEAELKGQINESRKELKKFTEQYLASLEESKNMFLGEISKIVSKSEKSFSKIEENSKSFTKEIDELKSDLVSKFSAVSHGGGSMNRQILVGGVNPLTRYTDYNLIAGAGITITTANDDANRRVNLTIVSSGSSSFETPVGTVDDSNLTFTVSNTPKYIIVNGAQYVVGTGLFSSYAAGTITLSSAVGTGGFIRSAY